MLQGRTAAVMKMAKSDPPQAENSQARFFFILREVT